MRPVYIYEKIMASEKCCQLNSTLFFWGVDPKEIFTSKGTQVDGEKEGILNIDHNFPSRDGEQLGVLDFKELASPDWTEP